MNQELQEDLFAIAPEWFRDREDITKSCMYFGFEIPDNWYPEVRALMLDLKKMNLPEDFQVVQVKSKFGGLRFYTNSGFDAIHERIAKAEDAIAELEKETKNCKTF